MKLPLCGRAHLLEALFDAADITTTARLMGYRRPAVPPLPQVLPEPVVPDPDAGPEPPVPDPDAPEPVVRYRPIPFWRVIEREAFKSDQPNRARPEPLGPEDCDPPGVAPEAPDLLPWPRLRPRLFRLLRSLRVSRLPDQQALTERVARQIPIDRVPGYRRHRFPRRVGLIRDLSDRLLPTWADQQRLLDRLRRVLGPSAVRSTVVHTPTRRTARRVLRMLAKQDRNVPVLVLSDLGAYATASERAAWQRFDRALRRRGRRLEALLPCPRDRWPDLARGRAEVWDRSSGAGISDRDRAEAARRLLRWTSFLLYVEPGLLRALRLALPSGVADIGTEIDAWRLVQERHVAGGTLDPTLRANLQQELAEDSDPAGTDQALALLGDLLPRWRRDASPVVANEEALTLVGLRGEANAVRALGEHARALPQWLERLVVSARDAVPGSDLSAWLERAFRRAPPGLHRERVLGRLLAEAFHASRAVDANPGLREWRIVPAVEGVRLVDLGVGGPNPSPPMEARVIAELHGGDDWVLVDSAGSMRPIEVGDTAKFSASGDRLVLQTDRERVVLEQFVQPMGADRIGSDRRGLWLEIGSRWEPTRFCWQVAEPDAPDRPTAGEWVHVSGSGLEWADSSGVDEHGVWAAVEIGGVTVRFRWVPGGEFVMGSPVAEAGRYDIEQQHRVELSGYWLAEVPVTQDLWTAVMGDNPSRFRSDRRPVEQVSWKVCQSFLVRVDARWPGLGLRLPTESEWEYAARAGTTTATYRGELELVGLNNAPVLDDIAWYGGNSGVGFDLPDGEDSSDWDGKQFDHVRAGTRIVGKKEPNGLGLFDVLGNVWEWCSDWYGTYPEDRVVDPVGSPHGGRRVLRGGSWNYHARDVRAAYRYHFPPGSRVFYVGFRLARGPSGSPEPVAEPPNQAEAKGITGRSRNLASALRPPGRRGTRRRGGRRAPEDEA